MSKAGYWAVGGIFRPNIERVAIFSLKVFFIGKPLFGLAGPLWGSKPKQGLGSEKWIAQISVLLDKMSFVGQISLLKYNTIPQNTYNLDNVQQCFFQVSWQLKKKQIKIVCLAVKLDGVSPVDNRPSTDELHPFFQLF